MTEKRLFQDPLIKVLKYEKILKVDVVMLLTLTNVMMNLNRVIVMMINNVFILKFLFLFVLIIFNLIDNFIFKDHPPE